MGSLDPKYILQTLPYAYALHQLVFDAEGKPCDYVFIDTNPLFEKYTGLKAVDILGKRASEVVLLSERDTRWIATCARIACKGETLDFEQYSETLQKWYRVNAYSREKGFFVTLFSDITEDKELELEALKTKKR